ncbi:MAG: hypothetical protein ACE366_10890 [Bradymonadia bacterium]
MRWVNVLLSCLVLCMGCGERDSRWEQSLQVSGVVVLGDSLVYSHPDLQAVSLFTPGELDLRLIALEARPRAVVPSPNGDGVLILDDQRGATWLPVSDEAARIRYSMPADFDQAIFSPEGDRAVAFFGPEESTDDASPVIRNPNEIAIFDLTTAPGESNPTPRTLRAFGESLTTLVIDPQRELMGRSRQLAWVLSDQYVTLIDLAEPSATERTIHLVPEGAEETITPAQVLLGEVQDRPMAFIRAEGTEQLFALSFEQAPEDERTIPKPSLNLLVSGRQPSDMVLETLPDGVRVLSVNAGESSVAMVDPVTGRRVRVSVDHDIRQVRTFMAMRPEGDEGPYALLWSEGSAHVSVADLTVLETRRSQAVSTLALPGAVRLMEPLPTLRRALAWVEEEGKETLVILDLDEGTATPLAISGTLQSVRLNPARSWAYATVETPSVEGGFAVVGVELATGRGVSSPVPAGRGELYLSQVKGETMVVLDHGKLLGEISFVPAAELGQRPFETRRGFMLDGILER